MSAAYKVALDVGSVLASVSVPVVSLKQIREIRAVLEQHDKAAIRVNQTLAALRGWAGPDLDGVQLGALVSGPLPTELQQGLADWQSLQAQDLYPGQDHQSWLSKQRELRQRLMALQERGQQEHTAAEASLLGLQQLLPLAANLIANQHRLAMLLGQQAEQRGRKLAGFWSAVSGRAAALQREIDQAQHARDEAQSTYRRKVSSLNLRAEIQPEEVSLLLERETQGQQTMQQQREADKQTLEDTIRQLGDLALSVQATFQHRRSRIEATWRDLHQRYGVPENWSIWKELWEQRELARALWLTSRQAAQELQEAISLLASYWTDWPAELQEVEALRQWLPRIEEVALARQQAAVAEAARRAREREQQTALIAILQGQVIKLVTEEHAKQERLRAEQHRLEEEDRQARELEAARLTKERIYRASLLMALQQQLAALTAEERTNEERRQAEHYRLEEKASQVRRLEAARLEKEQIYRASLITALQQRSATLIAEEHAKQERLRAEQHRLEEEVQQARELEARASAAQQASEAVAPVSPAAPHPYHEVRSLHLDAGRQRPGVAAFPALGPENLQTARGLLVRHAGAAAQAAMCQEALEEWAGPGVNALRLAALVSRSLPPTLERAMADWETLSQGSPENLTGPPAKDKPKRRTLQWEAAWTDLRRTLGVPAQPEHWQRLWASRTKAQSLWEQREQARTRMQAQEAGMAALWETWPAEAQNVAGLRQAVEKVGGVAPAKLQQGRQEPRSAGAVLSPPMPVRQAPPSHVPSPKLTPPVPAPALPSGGRLFPPGQNPAARGSDVLPGELKNSVEDRSVLPSTSFVGALTGADSSSASLLPEQMEVARALLRQHAAAAAHAAQTHKGLDTWAGKELDGLRLGKLISQPLPLEVELAFAAWQRSAHTSAISLEERRRAADEAVQAERERASGKLGPLRLLRLLALALISAEGEVARASGVALKRTQLRLTSAREAYTTQASALGVQPAPLPADLERLISQEERTFQTRMAPLEVEWRHIVEALREEAAAKRFGVVDWEKAWAGVCQKYGLPQRPGRWEILLSERAEGQFLWVQWHGAQREAERLEVEMGLLWAGWPTEARNVTGLRQALEHAGRAAGRVTALVPMSAARPTVQEGHLNNAPGDRAEAQSVKQALPGPPLPSRVVSVPLPPPLLPQPSRALVAAPSPAMPTMNLPSVPSPGRGVRHVALAAPSLLGLPSLPGTLITPPLQPLRVRVPSPALPGQPQTATPAAPEPATPSKRLSTRQRAEREAVRISEQYNWRRGFLALADALDREKWGQLRASIEREIACGMTPDEFELMLQLRAYWHDQIHFQSPYTSRYDSLPWGLGLALIRRSAGVPCLEEMIILMERLYDYAEWACTRRSLPAFAQRLGAILDQADPDVDLEYWLCAQEARCFSR